MKSPNLESPTCEGRISMRPRLVAATVLGAGASAFVLLLNLTFLSGPSLSSGPDYLERFTRNFLPIMVTTGYGALFGKFIASRKTLDSARYITALVAILSLWTYILIIQLSSVEDCLFTGSCREYSWDRFWSATVAVATFLSFPVGLIGLCCGGLLYRGNKSLK